MGNVVVQPLVVSWPDGTFVGPTPPQVAPDPDEVDRQQPEQAAADVARLLARRAAERAEEQRAPGAGAADVARLLARRRQALPIP